MKIYGYEGRYNLAGIRIRQARKAKKLSQEGLAAQLQLLGLDVTQRAISRIETGDRVLPDYELSFYAQALDVSILWLLDKET